MKYSSFTQLPNYQTSIDEAQELSMSARESTFLFHLFDSKIKIFGFNLKKFTVKDFLFLESIGHLIIYGRYTKESCLGFLRYMIQSRLPSLVVELIILSRAKKEAKLNNKSLEDVLIDSVKDFVEKQTIDIPGKWSISFKKTQQIAGQVSPHYYFMSFVCVVMSEFPSYTFDYLTKEINVGLFFQLYQTARTMKNPEYTIDSPVDYVNRRYLSIFNKLKKMEEANIKETI